MTTDGTNAVDIVLGGSEPRSAGPVQLTATVSLIIHDGGGFNTLNDSGLNSVTANPSNTDGVANSPNGGWKRTGETNFNSTDSSFTYTANGSGNYSRSAPGESASGTGTVDDEFTTTTFDSTNKVLDVVHNTFVTTTISDKTFTIDNSTTSTGGGTYTIPFDAAPMSGEVEEESTETMNYSNSEYKETELTTSATPPPPANTSNGTNPTAPAANAPVPTVKLHTGLMTMSMVSSQSYSRDGGGGYVLPDGTVGTLQDKGSSAFSVTYDQNASIIGGVWIIGGGSQTSSVNSSVFHSDISDLTKTLDNAEYTNVEVTLHKSDIRDHSNSVITTKTLASDATWSGTTTTNHTIDDKSITDETATGDYSYVWELGIPVTGTGTSTNKTTQSTYETETKVVSLLGNPISHTGSGFTSLEVKYEWEVSGSGELELNPSDLVTNILNDDEASIGTITQEDYAKLTLTELERGSTKTTHSIDSTAILGELVPKEEKNITETKSFSLSEIVDHVDWKDTTDTTETVDGVLKVFHGTEEADQTITDRISTDTLKIETKTTNRLLTDALPTTTGTETVKIDNLRKIEKSDGFYQNTVSTANGATSSSGESENNWRNASDLDSSEKTITNGVTAWSGHVQGELDEGHEEDSWPVEVDDPGPGDDPTAPNTGGAGGGANNNSSGSTSNGGTGTSTSPGGNSSTSTGGTATTNPLDWSNEDSYYAPAGYVPPERNGDEDEDDEGPILPDGVVLDKAGGLGKFVTTDANLATPPSVPSESEVPLDEEGNPIVTPLPTPPTTPPTSPSESTEVVIEEKEEEMTSAADTERMHSQLQLKMRLKTPRKRSRNRPTFTNDHHVHGGASSAQ